MTSVKIKNFVNVPVWLAFILGGLVGLTLFLFLYGVKTLNPSDITWMSSILGTDITISNNWAFYRNAQWMFPLGLFEGVGSQPMSVVYLESGSLYAIFFKILSPILPTPFYYLGIMQCVNFILQGAFGALIGRFFFKNIWGVIAGTAIFLCTLPIMQRTFYHPTLAQQWLILLPLLLWLYKDKIASHQTLIWALILPLSAYGHPYFLPISFALFCGYHLEDIIPSLKQHDYKGLQKTILSMGIVIGILLIHFYLLGIFSTTANRQNRFGAYSIPFLSLFVPYSRPDLQNFGPFFFLSVKTNQLLSDGNTYLGFGVMLGLFISLWHYFSKKDSEKKTLRGICMLVVGIGLYILALGLPESTPDHIFDLPILKFLSSFRASGRFVWGTLYLIIIFIFTEIKSIKKWGAILIAVVVSLQVIDMTPSFIEHRNLFTSRAQSPTTLFQDPAWQEIKENYTTFYFLPEINSADVRYETSSWGLTDMGIITLFAGINKLKMSDATLGGWDNKALEKSLQAERQKLASGISNPEYVYVFKTLPESNPAGLNFYRLENKVIIGTARPLEQIEETSTFQKL